MDCPIVIFYEMHDNSIVSDTIYKLLPTLRKYEYKNFAVEFPKNSPFKSIINSEKAAAQSYYKQFKKLSDMKMGEALEFGYQIAKPYKKLATTNEKKVFIDFIKDYFINRAKASYSKVDLLENLKKHNIDYTFIGGKDGKNYDPQLIDNIKETCHKHDSGIIAYLGINHLAVGKALRSESSKVSEYYIVVHDTLSTKGSPNHNDYLVRTNGLSHDIEVIDLYQNPNLDPTQIIKESLINYHHEL